MKRLLLAGAGHAHALVLRDWARAPLPGVELVVVAPSPKAPYSGMVPGWMSGAYRFEQITVDFEALCAAANARWVPGELDSLDPDKRRVRLVGGQALDYSLLSLNVGSTLHPPRLPGPARVLSMRPLAALREGYQQVLDGWCSAASTRPFTVTAVGAGAAGFESLLAVLTRLRGLRPDRPVRGRLLSRGHELLPGMGRLARRAAARALDRAGVQVHLGETDAMVRAADGDLVLWATGAQALDWQADPVRRGGLVVGASGFVRVDEQLRSLSHLQVYAAGDCAEWAPPLPKAGVYAVRMGPVLARNLRAALGHGRAASYVPQRRFLALLATGDGSAIAAHGAWAAHGRWAWRWKDHIDRGFVGSLAVPPGFARRPQGLR